MSSRKARKCRKCGQAMKGHRAMSCLVSPSPSPSSSRIKTETDDEEHDSESSGPSYLSPPPSPPPPSSTHTQPSASGASTSYAAPVFVRRTYTPGILSEPSFEIPDTGYFHRVNPNYRGFVQPTPIHAARSLTPTEIVGSDGQPVSSSVRSASPAQSDRTVQLSDSGQARPKDLLEGLGSIFNLQKSRSGDIKGKAAVTNKNYPYWSNGTAVLDGTWQVDQQEGVVFTVRTAVTNFVGSSSDFLVGFLRHAWGFFPHFFATLIASVLAHYICKTYM